MITTITFFSRIHHLLLRLYLPTPTRSRKQRADAIPKDRLVEQSSGGHNWRESRKNTWQMSKHMGLLDDVPAWMSLVVLFAISGSVVEGRHKDVS